jgi:1-deoxy-D-xylulose-5-phosphate synthase
VIDPEAPALPIGQGRRLREGKGVALLAFGSLVAPALEAAQTLDATVADMRFVKPLDLSLILALADSHSLLVTLEENSVAGGAGSAVAELLAEHHRWVPCVHLGLPDRYLEQAEHGAQLAACALDSAGIAARVRRELAVIDETRGSKPLTPSHRTTSRRQGTG